MDGHTGIGNNEVNRGQSDGFVLILAALKEASGRTYFVIHATCNSYGSDLPPGNFLQSLGFSPFRGVCQFHQQQCYWAHILELRYKEPGFADDNQVHYVHESFKKLASKMGEIYEAVRKLYGLTGDLGLTTPIPKVIGDPVIIEMLPSDAPSWVDTYKFESLKKLEHTAKTLKSQVLDLRVYLPLLYASGDALEDAVLAALTKLGLLASKTPKGFTTDILAEDASGERKFGFEVTGINGPIKKDSPKLTQLQEFDRIKEHGEKTILLANTFRDRPITERSALENFTQQVVSYFSKHDILMMTTYDLYRLVEDAIENRRTSEDAIKLLHETNGVFVYNNP